MALLQELGKGVLGLGAILFLVWLTHAGADLWERFKK